LAISSAQARWSYLEDKSRIISTRDRAACSRISARNSVTRSYDLSASVPCVRKHETQQLQSGHGVNISASVPQKHRRLSPDVPSRSDQKNWEMMVLFLLFWTCRVRVIVEGRRGRVNTDQSS
jgi:hypothetical protein